ncbi:MULTISPECIES: RNA polymerase sigma factor [unclassified Streptomyces]|uniref:RNA polymerase sigma factor n=1 Tax=unclassified Streptomyces TaxID=2593676 RepID=UPI00101E5137|nr:MULTISPECIES: sigma-70 family RNA polymerase sigma factor [unclassified Streptomyces]MBZ9638285.1 sigma-70 family RNA polymerase sigma factor [Streptomyces sp. PSKA30]RZB13312.1 sigma-70 family RNA polymerase sigma factor [Streptomyces sp. F001]
MIKCARPSSPEPAEPSLREALTAPQHRDETAANSPLRVPDDLLAVRAGEGDAEAFALLVRRHSPSMLALAFRMLGNAQDAEDAVQDAFVSAWQRLPEFRHTAAFRTWMYRITVNRCLNARRHRRATLPLNAVTEPAAGMGSSPSGVAEQDALTVALTTALAALDPEQRACWILRELHGLAYEEIAHVTSTSEQTVRGRLYRARRSLKEALKSWR